MNTGKMPTLDRLTNDGEKPSAEIADRTTLLALGKRLALETMADDAAAPACRSLAREYLALDARRARPWRTT